MTPDRLRGWLKTRPAGATRIQIVADSPNGPEPVADWAREELETLETPEQDVADTMIQLAQEYCDAEGQKQKFLIRWLNESDRPLKVTTHHVKPAPQDETGTDTSLRTGVSDATIIRDLLKHLERKELTFNGALESIVGAQAKTIAMLSGQIENLGKQLAELRATPPVVTQEVTPEQREESLQRAKALEAFTSKIPEVVDMALMAAARKVLPSSDYGADSEGEH